MTIPLPLGSIGRFGARAQVLERDECERRGMGLYLGVASASARPPKFIHLTYTPKEAHASCRKVALVGKGDAQPLSALAILECCPHASRSVRLVSLATVPSQQHLTLQAVIAEAEVSVALQV